jgi:pantoate--beta-alanine ligase
MEIVKDPVSLATILNEVRSKNIQVGFVPTMGYLHEGHGSLIDVAKKDGDFCVVSIFVNPTQFAVGEDLDKYPRDINKDTKYCEEKGVDILFLPEVEYLYGKDSSHSTIVSVPGLKHLLDGEFRPTHFDGVTTIVAKLLNIVGPSRCYMGMKDAQQVSIIYRMVKELFMNNTIVPCPIVREDSHLAMSSRNTYLTDIDRENATAIYETLDFIGESIEKGNTQIAELLEDGKKKLKNSNLEVQYLDFVDFETLEPVNTITQGQFVLAVAVLCGKTRLIDNFFIHINEDNEIFIDRGLVFDSVVDQK